ncbi:hypothetical protein [Fructobacillus fructosus]|uniref:hypothetical protein n=1 Tax=Fructobacillus fructosus TaxID=1631 RepID=UPI0003035B3A|nr:hypothetical protein [Fructobacillus fructosus]
MLQNLLKKKKISILILVFLLIASILGIRLVIHQNDAPTQKMGNNTLSSALSSKSETIWYSAELEDLDRSTVISTVFVLKNSKITTYNLQHVNDDEQLTISKINKMNDQEILSTAKKLDKESFDNHTKELKEKANKEKQTAFPSQKTLYDELLKNLDQLTYRVPQEIPVSITSTNNGKDHTPTTEYINYNIGEIRNVENVQPIDQGLMYPKYVYTFKKDSIWTDQDSLVRTTIDDHNFAGFSHNFFTKVKNNDVNFVLDKDEKSKLITNNTD